MPSPERKRARHAYTPERSSSSSDCESFKNVLIKPPIEVVNELIYYLQEDLKNRGDLSNLQIAEEINKKLNEIDKGTAYREIFSIYENMKKTRILKDFNRYSEQLSDLNIKTLGLIEYARSPQCSVSRKFVDSVSVTYKNFYDAVETKVEELKKMKF